ncbi:hypothetical protein HDU83_007455 [Entophlyctis luteolus]|nr:hypothetical protein HDU83_007455 [Entophlyctis luteolus]
MRDIDAAIQTADSLLARGCFRLAYCRYLHAIRLIADYTLKNTVFEKSDDPESRAKDAVVTKPPDAQRLFGLAHLCFTEVEDICEGTVSLDDLSSDSGSGGDEEEDFDDVEFAASETTPEDGKEGDSSGSGAPPAASSTVADFRQQRLSRPRSICNSVRSSVRLSVLALNNPISPPLPESGAPLLPKTSEESIDSESSSLIDAVFEEQKSRHDVEKVSEVANSTVAAKKDKRILRYVPQIPTSPLQYQHTQILQSYSRCVQELDHLNKTTTTSSQQALQTLAIVRRLMETSTLLKNKMSLVASEISQANSKQLLDFTPRQLAVNIHLCDWELFSNLITIEDLLVYQAEVTPDLPKSFRSCMDFSIFVKHVVASSVLKTALAPAAAVNASAGGSKQQSHSASISSRLASSVSLWLQTLQHFESLRNYQSLHAVLSGLRHVAVLRLWTSGTPAYAKIPVKLRDSASRLWSALADGSLKWQQPAQVGSSDGSALVVGGDFPVVPLLGMFVDELKTLSRAPVQIAKMQGDLERWRCGGANASAAYGIEKAEKNVSVLHWILSQEWVSEEGLWQMSLSVSADGDEGDPPNTGTPKFPAAKRFLDKFIESAKNRGSGGTADSLTSTFYDSSSQRDWNDHVFQQVQTSVEVANEQTAHVVDLLPAEAQDPSYVGAQDGSSTGLSQVDTLTVDSLRSRLAKLKNK